MNDSQSRNRGEADGILRRLGRDRRARLAVAGVIGAAWSAGVIATAPKYDPVTGVSPYAAVEAESTELSGAAWDLPNLDHDRVDYWIERFTTDKRDEFASFLARSGRYVPMIEGELSSRGMPLDLVYLAMIESGFDPRAYSHADASGLWQFIEETGRRYGLVIDDAIDERNDPLKATQAALDYLGDLHDRFGSWYLAAAAYNTGENRVARIMREETGSERGDEQSYFRIYDRLPKETRDYVPLMIAAGRIAKEPHKYGFADVEVEPPLAFEEVVVDPATPLSTVASAAGVVLDELRDLNPHLVQDRTPKRRRHLVRLPPGARTAFLVNWPEEREADGPRADSYRVRADDSLLALARR